MARRPTNELTREELKARREGQRKSMVKRRQKEKAEGLCNYCGKLLDRWGTRCTECAPLKPTREPMPLGQLTAVKLTVEQLTLILSMTAGGVHPSIRQLRYRVALALRDRGHWDDAIEEVLRKGPMR